MLNEDLLAARGFERVSLTIEILVPSRDACITDRCHAEAVPPTCVAAHRSRARLTRHHASPCSPRRVSVLWTVDHGSGAEQE